MITKKQSYTPGPWRAEPSDDGHEIQMATRIENVDGVRAGYKSHHIVEYNHGCNCDEEPGTPAWQQVMEAEANARLISLAPEMADCLTELYAMVKGESPSLLREDSGGCARLDMDISTILAKINGDA